MKFIGLFQFIATVVITRVAKLYCSFSINKQPVVDPSRRYLFVANHQSYLDSFAVFAKVPLTTLLNITPIRYMTAGGLYYSWRWPFLAACGCFPHKKLTKPDYNAVNQSIKYLNSGQNLFIYPEGKRVLQKDSQPRSGVTKIIDGYSGSLTIILVHIAWERDGWRRKMNVSFEPYSGDKINADQIMDRVYGLELS